MKESLLHSIEQKRELRIHAFRKKEMMECVGMHSLNFTEFIICISSSFHVPLGTIYPCLSFVGKHRASSVFNPTVQLHLLIQSPQNSISKGLNDSTNNLPFSFFSVKTLIIAPKFLVKSSCNFTLGL